MKYFWDEEKQAYYDEHGRRIPRSAVEGTVHKIIGKVTNRLLRINDDLREESDTRLAQRAFQREITLANQATAALAAGGLKQISPAAKNLAERRIALEVTFFVSFGSQSQQAQMSDAQSNQRMGNFAARVWSNFQAVAREARKEAGFTEARRLLDPAAEHCEPKGGRLGCDELADQGWVPIDEMIAIGDAACYANCRCSTEYRRGGESGD